MNSAKATMSDTETLSPQITSEAGVNEDKSVPPRSSVLPANIDPAAAVSSFRSQQEMILKLIRNCLPTLATSLYSQRIIPQDVKEKACNENRGSSERAGALLECVEARIEVQPSDFTMVVHILESDPFLEVLAEELVQNYRTYSETPADDCSTAVSSAISHYRTYLKSVYRSSPISPENKWPPTPSKEYIHLAMVKDLTKKCRDQYIGSTLQGNIQEVLEKRKEISMEQILETESEDRGRVILVEGAPGVGKSTLAWELCLKWEEYSSMKKYSLVVLLRLREERVQKITSVSQLFYSCEDPSLAGEVVKNGGSGILFILDGFDELPQRLQKKGFLLELIRGRILPESKVLVTSRPSATAELLTSCRPQIQKRIEILGFTQESVEAYAHSVFSSEPEKLEKFKAYISASSNPAINSLMYIPLNAAIIVEIYNSCDSEELLPHTLTELYTQLSLTILNRHLEVRVDKFEDLPKNLNKHFLALSSLAFQGFVNEEVIFHSLSPSLLHFGFLDAVSALYGGGGVSYNFLHLTLQEFFAAYHISCLGSGGLEVFKQHGKDERWNIVWRFVAGLTKFMHLGPLDDSDLFIEHKHDRSILTHFFIECLFEAQTMKYCNFTNTCFTKLVKVDVKSGRASDSYILGYCIANYLVRLRLCVYLQLSPLKPFLDGLKAASLCSGVVEELHFLNHPFNDFAGFRAHPIIHTVISLSFRYCVADWTILSQLIPHMHSLKMLGIQNCGVQDGLFRVLQQLSHTKVTSLDLTGQDFSEDKQEDCYTALKKLISLPSGRLETLTFGRTQNLDKFILLLSSPSSLKTVCIDLSQPAGKVTPMAYNDSQAASSLAPITCSLCNNTCITRLELKAYPLPFVFVMALLVKILKCNTTLLHVKLDYFKFPNDIDVSSILTNALSKNSTLQCIEVWARTDTHVSDINKYVSEYMQIELDSRISWKEKAIHSRIFWKEARLLNMLERIH